MVKASKNVSASFVVMVSSPLPAGHCA